MTNTPYLNLRGVRIYQGYLSPAAQRAVLAGLRAVTEVAPMVHPVTQRGFQMSVKMTSAGSYGWISDRRGYRYEPLQKDGSPWPAIPEPILDIWRDVSGTGRMPDCCLVNYYGEGARMGMHQDRDEASFEHPVVSLSLGDDGLFRIGNPERGGKTESLWLTSGDVLVMGGEARLLYHGIDRIRFGSSRLTSGGGRVNVTLRVVN